MENPITDDRTSGSVEASEVERLRDQIAILTEQWKRAAADYANFEKRVAREKEESQYYSNSRLWLKILPIRDLLTKAIESSPNEGVSLVLKQFDSIIKSEGIEEIGRVGDHFDPNIHDCVDVCDGDEDGIVVEILRNGYKMKERILRPAQVKVTKVRK